MFYGDILHQTVNVHINMSPTTCVLSSGRSYATVSPPRSRGRPISVLKKRYSDVQSKDSQISKK
eukprot:scaffold69873_cov30-Cyclotella_meneghiniana.AAC.1